ncbi:MAG: Mut7-C RNAse domain-containing protein [Elusimicrobiales bacterium]
MKFICDLTVQKLGRLLILCGYDAKIIRTNKPIEEISEESARENRIIITRNTRVKNYHNKYVLLVEQKPYNQFKRLVKELNLELNENNFFTRCSACNLPLEKTNKSDLSDKIPELTKQNTEDFFICPSCKKIYWKQSHYDMFKEKVKKLFYL